jgi:hypothetical protein
MEMGRRKGTDSTVFLYAERMGRTDTGIGTMMAV